MSGNVYEWCSDWYSEYTSMTQTDPIDQTSLSYRVARGGFWHGVAGFSRISFRIRYSQEKKYSIIGFRIVKTIQKNNHLDFVSIPEKHSIGTEVFANFLNSFFLFSRQLSQHQERQSLLKNLKNTEK